MTVVSAGRNSNNWDIPVCHYKRAQRENSQRLINSKESLLAERAGASSESEIVDVEGRSLGICRPNAQLEEIVKQGGGKDEDACTRLYLDYFKRRQEMSKAAHAREVENQESQQREKAVRFQRSTPTIQADKQRMRHAQIQKEHVILSHAMQNQRDLEEERNSYSHQCPPRLYPRCRRLTDAARDCLERLRALGDRTRNAESINTLICSVSPDEIHDFCNQMEWLRDEQKATAMKFFNCNAYSSFLESTLTADVADSYLDEIDQALRLVGVIELREPFDRSGDITEIPGEYKKEERWMADTELCDELIRDAVRTLTERGFVEDLFAIRREWAFEMDMYLLSLLSAITRLDVQMKEILAHYRLGKFHVRGYEPEMVEKIKETDWYLTFGSTTSLRNNMKIRASTRRIMGEAEKVLKRERPLPDPERDPNRELFEAVLDHRAARIQA